jgi:hypothetical protein
MAVVARLLGAHFEDIDADTLLEAAGLSDLASGINDTPCVNLKPRLAL